ncbi:MAG: hypothetical protein NW206_19720 [Hyphomonadaceae bacterium]|nr:hypothetical protein [Hyphomonadaceae bacterium]
MKAEALARAIEQYAAKAEAASAAIKATTTTMQKPGERRTRDDLERRARLLDSVVWRCRDALRAIKAAPELEI